MMRLEPRLSLPLVTAISAVCIAQLADAGILEWAGSTTGLGTGSSDTWDSNTTANWWDGASLVNWPAPGGTDDDAVFGGTAGTVTIAAGGVTARDVTFNTSGYTLTGGTLALNGILPAIITATGIDATIASTIDGTAGLIKAGAGTLSLTGSATHTGGTAVSDGTLTIGSTGSLGVNDTTTRRLTVTGDGSLLVDGGEATFRGSGGTDSAALVIGHSDVGGGGNVTVQNNGSLILSQGRFIMGGGASSAASNEVPTAVFTQTSGTTDISANSTSLIGNITPGSLEISGGTFTASISSQFMLGVRASSSLTVSGTNTLVTVGELRFGWSAADATVVADTAVTMNLDGGTLAVPRIAVSGSTANRTHTFNFDGGTLQATGDSATFFSPTLALTATVGAGGGTIDNNGFDIGIAQSLLTGGSADGGLTFTGGGTTTLSGTNTFTSDITVSNGTLIGAGAVNGGGGVPVLGARDNTRTITINSGATLQFNSGNILGANHVATTAPTLIIHEGGTVTNGGIATNNALNDIQLTGGTLTSTTGHTSSSEPFAPVYGAWNLNGSVTSTGTSTISTSDPTRGWIMLKVPGDKTTDFNVASGSLTVSAPVVDNPTDGNIGSLSKSGAGDMILSAASTYSGSTTIKEGTLFLTGATQATTAITFDAGGVLGLDTGVSVAAASAALDLADGAIRVTGAAGDPSYTLLTASSISGTPVLADPVPGYEIQVVGGNELRLVQTGATTPYETWAGVGMPFDGDANGDGVSNGLAFLLYASGPNANAFDKLPKPTENAGGLVMTFQTLTTTARGTAQLMLEYSNSLATESWTTVTVPGTAGDFTDGNVSFTLTGTGPLNVTATISAAASNNGKLFARLKAEGP